jgi:endonuclease/exonuclease/phosphatase family metal-dependent hydrolase
MKLLSLNTWGARAGIERLKDFLAKHRDIDVFCFQEIWQTMDRTQIEGHHPTLVTNLLENITSWLPDYQVFFRPQYRNIYGLATFVKKEIHVADEGEVFVFKHQGFENPVAVGNHARNIQYVTVQTPAGLLTIINFHGLWNGQGKSDTPDRILQSEKIAEFIRTLKNPHVLAGDFNLHPETESLKILESVCPKNLIKEFGITSTRSSLYTKPIKFADYIMTSESVNVANFEVLPDEVSDHLALRTSVSVGGL